MDHEPDFVRNRTIVLSSRFALAEMKEADLGQVLALERDSFPTPWSRDGFLTTTRTNFGRAWVVLDRNRKKRTVVGYLCCWIKAASVQVVNICVAGSYRGQGLGRVMMDFIISWARLKTKEKVTLEVRPGNSSAIKLYQDLGFAKVGVQAGYYPDTGEEAFLYELLLRTGVTA